MKMPFFDIWEIHPPRLRAEPVPRLAMS
jgi:hypothetical protein